jgi:hypothetical protein
LIGLSEVTGWAFVNTSSIGIDDSWAVVPTSSVVKISSSGAGNTVSSGTETLGTSEVADLTDTIHGESTFSTFLDTLLIDTSNLQETISRLAAGT